MRMWRIGDYISAHLVILRSAGVLVPRWRRADWLAEWRSELWYVSQRRNREDHRSWWNREAVFFCLGAFRDAVWLRRHTCDPDPRGPLWLQSPLRCLLFLGALAAVATVFFFRSPGPLATLLHTFECHRERIFAHFLTITIALLIVPSITSPAPREYPTAPHSPTHARRFHRWIFLGLKFGLILPIVFFGTLDLSPIVSATGLQPHATLVSYVLAFRWALIEQRRRCPVCLRLLTNPARIGQAGRTFLEWYGTELICVKGHGLMHVPEIQTTYSTQHWLDLDLSWNGLFS